MRFRWRYLPIVAASLILAVWATQDLRKAFAKRIERTVAGIGARIERKEAARRLAAAKQLPVIAEDDMPLAELGNSGKHLSLRALQRLGDFRRSFIRRPPCSVSNYADTSERKSIAEGETLEIPSGQIAQSPRYVVRTPGYLPSSYSQPPADKPYETEHHTRLWLEPLRAQSNNAVSAPMIECGADKPVRLRELREAFAGELEFAVVN